MQQRQLAPAVQQMIANNPALAQQAAIKAFEIQNQRNAIGYQGIDALTQNILRGIGMYGDMQQQEADSEFREKKFEHDKFVELRKLVLDGDMTYAQIDNMGKQGRLTDVTVDRLIALMPSDVRQGEAAAGMGEAQLDDFNESAPFRNDSRNLQLDQARATLHRTITMTPQMAEQMAAETSLTTEQVNELLESKPFRRAMEGVQLAQGEADVDATTTNTAAVAQGTEQSAELHPFKRRMAANAANMSDQEFSEWMLSHEYRQLKKQYELEMADAQIGNVRANTISTRDSNRRAQAHHPLDIMQAEENILGTRSSTRERDMLLLPRIDNLDANTRGMNASANTEERLLPSRLTAGRLGNLQTEQQTRSIEGQEDRAQARHPGEMDLQGLNIASARLALEDSAIKHTFLEQNLEAEYQNLLSRTGLQDAQASVLEAEARIAANPPAASPERWQKSVQEEMTSIEFNLNSRMQSISAMMGNDTLLKEMMRTNEGKDALLQMSIEQARISASLPKLSQLRITMAGGTYTTENEAWSALGTALGVAGGGKAPPAPPSTGGLSEDEHTFNVGGTVPK